MSATRKKSAARPTNLASVEGTRRYAARHADFVEDFYRPLTPEGPRVASIALGTYLGECDAADDARYMTTARNALESGINLIDSAINYRCQRSERSIGRALARAFDAGTVARDEVVICTKGGYIPLEETPPASRAEYQAMLEREYFRPGLIRPEDVVAGGHCLAPAYLADQIGRSRRNLGVDAIDVYYLHNPEQQLEVVERDTFRERMLVAFRLLEERCTAGEIGLYGCATWNGLRVPPDDRHHLSLSELVELAREAGGDGHHFGVVQLPVNLAMNEAVRVPTQRLDSQDATVMEAAAALGVGVIASASLMQAKLSRGLPSQLREAIPGFQTDAQRAIAFVRSLPVAAALVGMRSSRHLEENLGAGRMPA